MKKYIVAFLMVVIAACYALAFTVFSAFAQTEDEYVKVVKTLIGENGGSANPGGSEWAQVGNYSSYNHAVEEIADPAQQDGGDMIFRTGTDVGNTSLLSGAWGFSKHSETRSKACYDINGLVIKYYDNTSTQKFIMFNENYGQLNSGRFFGIRFNMTSATQGTNNGNVQLGLWHQANVNGSYVWDPVTWTNWSDYNYGNDYDYFSDPAAEHYVEGNTFKGTQNTLEFKLNEENDLCLILNGKQMANLTDLNIVSDVISHCTEGMYISFWGEGSNGTNAFKLTDIYNEVKEWSDGVPSGYTTTAPANVQNKISSTGAVQFRPAGGAASYDAQYETAQYLSDLKLNFSLAGGDMAANDTVTVSAGDIRLQFRKTDATTAALTVMLNDVSLGEQTMPFYFTDVTNSIEFSQLKDFKLTVNGETFNGDISAFTQYEQGLQDGKVKVGYRVESAAASVLTPIEYISKELIVYESVEGLTVTGENTVIKSDGDYMAVYNTADGEFSVNPDKKAILNSMSLNYRFGATNEAVDKFVIKADKLSFEFTRSAGVTTLTLYAEGAERVEIAKGQIDFDWQYGQKSFRFVNDNGYGYMVSDGVAELLYIDGQENKAGFDRIDEIVKGVQDGMTEVTFVSANGQGIFAFTGIDYYVETSVKAGWKVGGYGTPKFGYDDGSSTTLVFNGNSIQKNNEIIVDGFEMVVKTFYDESGLYLSPAVVIASSESWFSLDTRGAFMFSIEKAEDPAGATFRVRGAIGSDRYLYIEEFAVNNWNWNNNRENTIKLNLTADNEWVWTINGTEYPSADEEAGYSVKYNQIYEDFITNAGTIQFDSGSGYIWKIVSLNEVVYNSAPVAGEVTLEENYKVNEQVTVDLNAIFSDANGDTLTFSVISGDATIQDGKLLFSSDSEGSYTVQVMADDGNGGTATISLTFNVKKDGGYNGCNGSIAGTGVSLVILLGAFAAYIIVKKKGTQK